MSKRTSDGLKKSRIRKQAGIAAGVPQAPVAAPAAAEQPTVTEPSSKGKKVTKA
jgi:hypothetical protein